MLQRSLPAALAVVVLLSPVCRAADRLFAFRGGDFLAEPAGVLPRVENPGRDFAFDGRLGDPVWGKACRLGDFVEIRTPVATQPKNRTTAWAFYDAENLYVAFECMDADIAKIQTGLPAGQATDVPIPAGADTAEILIVPNGRDGEFYHLRIVPSGAKADLKCRRTDDVHCVRDATWNGDWQAKASIGTDRWTLEAKIPFRIFAEGDFGYPAVTPVKGEAIRINCGRYAAAKGETTALQRGLGLFHTVFPAFVCGGFPYGDVGLVGKDGFRFKPGANDYAFVLTNLSSRTASVRVRAVYSEDETDPEKRRESLRARKWAQPRRQTSVHDRTYEVRPGASVADVVRFDVARAGEGLQTLGLTADWERMKMKISTLTTADGVNLEAQAKAADRAGPGILAKTVADVRRAHPGAQFAIGTADASQKVFRDMPYEGSFSSDASISLARNEYESAQFVVFRLSPARGPIRVTVGDLKGPGGASIRGESVEIHQVGFVNVGDSGHHVHAGYWPDVLYPGATVPMPVRGDVQSVMLTVKAPKDAPAGAYRGEVVFEGEGERQVGTLTATVYDFTLPDTLTLRMNIWFHGMYSAALYGNFPFPLDYFRSYMEVTGRYRFAACMRGNLLEALVRIHEDPSAPDGYRLDFEPLAPYYDISMSNGANVVNFDPPGCENKAFFTRPRWRNYVRMDGSLDYFRPPDPKKAKTRAFCELRDWFKRRGYWPYAVMQVGDEPWSERQQREIRETVEGLRARCGEIPPIVTAGAVRGRTNLDGVIDIWCPQYPQYDAKDYAGMDRTKERLWLYQCLFKIDFPSFQIDRPSFEPRISALVCRKAGAEGFLYWSSEQWTTSNPKSAEYKAKRARPWIHEEWPFPIEGCPGDGCFVYPTSEGVIPSLRAQYIRDGSEDYEYLEILSRLYAKAREDGIISPDLGRRVEELLAIPDDIVRSTNEWTRDFRTVNKFRGDIARAIGELKKGK